MSHLGCIPVRVGNAFVALVELPFQNQVQREHRFRIGDRGDLVRPVYDFGGGVRF